MPVSGPWTDTPNPRSPIVTLLHHHRVHDPYDQHDPVDAPAIVHALNDAQHMNHELAGALAFMRAENRDLCVEIMRLRNNIYQLERRQP